MRWSGSSVKNLDLTLSLHLSIHMNCILSVQYPALTDVHMQNGKQNSGDKYAQ